MQSNSLSVDQYVQELSEERKEAISKLRATILENLPIGFQECMSYGMIGYVVPHTEYPAGYHCDPSLPLPFMSVASQKNAISFYHMGIYADKDLFDWFVSEYPKHCTAKLDMGKSCIRFKKIETIPYSLIGELVGKVTKDAWVECYERMYKQQGR